MIIYLDESGDLGFDFNRSGTSQYLIMTCLVCENLEAIQTVKKAIRLTRKNKLGKNIGEVKGSNTSPAVKKYFFNHLEKNANWEIMTVAANKQAWLLKHDHSTSSIDKNLFYDEVAKRLLSQIQIIADAQHIQLIIDKSKTPSALKDFNHRISTTLSNFISAKTKLSIHHRHSFAEAGLQAIDLFSWGIYRKYQLIDHEWYDVFKHRIALEMEFKF